MSFSDPMAILFAGALLGLAIGSFLNVVIHRLPLMMERDWQRQCAELRGEAPPTSPPLSLWRPRSRCPHCGNTIRAIDNIPLLSFLLLSGRCRHCQAPIGWRYPLIEAATAIFFAAASWRFGLSLQLFAAWFFIAVSLALAAIDLDTQLLPDDLTLPLLWAGLLLNLGAMFAPLPHAVIGAAAGYLALWSVYWLFKLATGKEGMGHGDFKLLAAIGAWFGWQSLPMVILLSSLAGAAVGIALILAQRGSRDIPIPFGPYLAAAGLIALFAGDRLQLLFPLH